MSPGELLVGKVATTASAVMLVVCLHTYVYVLFIRSLGFVVFLLNFSASRLMKFLILI